MFTIEKGIPIPPRTVVGRPAIYPFGSLKLGESFAIPPARTALLRDAAKQWRRRHPGWDFTVRKSADEVRLWCIATPEA